MNLNHYKALIQSMPVLDQAFVVKANNWDKQLLPEHLSGIFKEEAEIMLSVDSLFYICTICGKLPVILIYG
ncbi:hypothetical protein [Sphingobacterium sp. JB170]|uniref:hypothetical protein n=1 Tax=Sphingobacterium sp. JB170 TaxID=1434842 RepID=UPI00097F3981|nr:hypothetical protein [Sphingobacterium sp. JB170]SJN49700.1 hypothetical protein FM107_19150 [Sphingobacterium sp. JB170]